MKLTLEERFWNKVAKNNENDCWVWTGHVDKDGYGLFKESSSPKDANVRAHRMAYRLIYGNFENEMWVLHSCDNPPCCNPSHLFLGTAKDNAADRDKKNRQCKGERHWVKAHPEKVPRGENAGKTKYTDQQVKEVLKLRKNNVPTRKIAVIIGMSRSNVLHIIKRRCRKDLSL